MSAFVVEDKTINRILFWLGRSDSGQYSNSWYLQRIAEGAELERSDPEFFEKLGASMMILNCQAVDERYDETNDPAFRYMCVPCNDYQALKSLRCWLYQCAEGSVPDRELFKAFEEVSMRLALALIDRSEMYGKAEWA